MTNQDDESIEIVPDGWFKLYRRIIKSEVFQDPNLLQLWVLLLSRSSINERYEQVQWGNANRIIHVLPGQCIVGRNQTARFLKWTPSSFRNRLERLRKMKMVQLTSYQGFTIVTIKNWSKFQTRNKSKKDSIKGQAENARKPLQTVGEVDSTLTQKDSMKGQAEDKPRTSGGQAEDTNKEGFKNDKESKEWGRIATTLVAEFETIFHDYPKLPQADRKRLAAEIEGKVQLGKVQPQLAVASLREAIGATLQRNKQGWSSPEPEIKTSTPTPRDASAPEPSDVERFFNSHVYPTLSQFHWESHSQFYDHWRQRHWQREGKPIDWQAEAVRPKRSPTQRGTI